MYQFKYRKHPRVYAKKNEEPENETILNISALTAAGILAFVFAKGIFWGCLLRKKFS